jgi:hypothetical protein
MQNVIKAFKLLENILIRGEMCNIIVPDKMR